MYTIQRRLLPLVAMAVLLAVLAAGCGPATGTAEDAEQLQIVVSVLPQEYFVNRIAGERALVTVMVPRGASPHTYEPRPEQMRALSRAQAYLAVGVTFEDVWMDRIVEANPDMLIVDTTEGIERMMIDAHGHDDDDDDDGDDDDDHADEQEPDPHVWVSPRLVKLQADTIYRTLAEIDPEHEAEYAANLAAFQADIDALDAEIREALDGIENRRFIVFHPAWGYFAAEYDLEQVPIEVGGVEPGAATLAEIIRTAREHDIRVILAQPEFSTEAAETIAREINGGVQLVSPLEPDWLDNMRNVGRIFSEVLRD